MTADLDALAASTPETGPICACGCGETLPAGSTRNYKRGHKTQQATPRVTPPTSTVTSDTQPDTDPFTLDDAARDTPNDPDPADWQEPTRPTIRITKAIREDIAGKLGMIFGFMSMGISIKDPICGHAISDNAEHIVPKMVPIVCKSPDMVRWFTSKNAGYIVWFELMMVCWPVLQVVISHHVTHTIGKPQGSGPTGQTVIPNPLVPTAPPYSAYRA
jgi:hypothetical protein